MLTSSWLKKKKKHSDRAALSPSSAKGLSMTSYQYGSRNEIEEFLLKANNFHSTIKFMAEISETETETTFLDTKVYKGVRFNKDSILDVRTHFKPTDIPIHEFVFVSPTRRHKRLHQRRSFKASKNKFL